MLIICCCATNRITPSFNQRWKTIEYDDDDTKHFILKISLNKSGRVRKKKLKEIPQGTKSIRIVIKVSYRLWDHIDRDIDFDKGYIPSSVTRVYIEYKSPKEIGGSDGWLPDSVTMLTVSSLPFPAALVPKNIRYLKVLKQERAIEIYMVPPTTEYLWIGGPSNTHGQTIVHSIPNTVKELVVDYDVLDIIQIKPTFTSPIHIDNPLMYNDRDRFAHVGLKDTLCNLNIQTITSSNTVVARLPTITSLVIEEYRYFNNNLSALHPLPPQLKYLSLPYTYNQPIYQQQNLPISLTHLELSVFIDENNHFTNNWLCRKGYLPPSITHLKINIYFEGYYKDINNNDYDDEQDNDNNYNYDDDDDDDSTHPLKKRKIDQNDGDQVLLAIVTKQDEYNEKEYDPLPSSLKILIPSSIQSVCFSLDFKSYRSHLTVLDKDDYYSTTPTPPKIRQGLKELVLPESFNNRIHNSTLPSTLQSLSINNPDYNNPLNSNNLPLSLTSFKCNSNKIKLDLSLFESIKELKVNEDTITYYPPNVETLELGSPLQKGYQMKFNKHLIKSLVYSPNPRNRTYGLSYLKELLDTLPNVQFLSLDDLDFEVPASVKELKCLNPSFRCTDARPISSPPFETLHLDLGYYLENHSQTQDNHQRVEKIINKHISNQQPMLNTFFKIWRNIYLKPLVLEALYDLTKSPLRFDSKTGTLENIDKFKQYNIFVDYCTQLGPALLKFDKADEVYIYNGTADTNLSNFISKSIKKLRCSFTIGIPDWITHLNLGDICFSDHEFVEIPPSVTNLTIDTNDEGYIGKIPPSVRYLTLNKLMDNQAHCIPPSVTHLYLVNTAFNNINKTDIPSTVQRIEFKKLWYQKDKGEYDIPSFISSRLVNGVFYIYSKLKYRITIPSNTTHLFWLDNQYIDNDGDGINIPPSVHTLVLDRIFNSAILSLPPTITQMIFQGYFRHSLGSISFPPTLKYLSFHQLNNDIQEQDLPNGLSHLSIRYISEIKSLPRSVHHLEFNSMHSHFPIPPQVKHLKFLSSKEIFLPTTIKSFKSPRYNNTLKEFTDSRLEISSPVSLFYSPSTSIHLYSIYDYFNSFIVPYTLGNNIKSITFGDSFNQVLIKGAIPNSVEKLVFGDRFNLKLNKSILPTSLMTLVLGRNFDQDLNDNIPSSLTELMLNTKSKPSFTSSSQFPPNLKKLALPCYDGVLDIIPTTINHLEFNRNIAKQKYVIFPIELVPPHITTLVLNDSIRIQSYDIIPASITRITLCDSITPYTKIPCTVESVVLPSSFNQPLDTILQTVDDHDYGDQ
ncbi:hypothetical protein CYY_003131 [Polysphondylium violaceum]|uniref:FNIP repeat-containing protein n=1 Tax=Polysphondylium violaceum TaxID=133409 RepID=A0A8J4PY52_9MYCE|nr:hypothetical protein CYY_003131 [Polysphondylium violaceum]